MTRPTRLQAQRGVSYPDGAEYVAKGRWWLPYYAGSWHPDYLAEHERTGEPFDHTDPGSHIESRVEAIELWRRHVLPWLDVSPLRGRDLICVCPIGEPCHADVLLEVANAEVKP